MLDFSGNLHVVVASVESLGGSEHAAMTLYHVLLLPDRLLLGLLSELADRSDVLNIVRDRRARVEVLLVGLVVVLVACYRRVDGAS